MTDKWKRELTDQGNCTWNTIKLTTDLFADWTGTLQVEHDMTDNWPSCWLNRKIARRTRNNWSLCWLNREIARRTRDNWSFCWLKRDTGTGDGNSADWTGKLHVEHDMCWQLSCWLNRKIARGTRYVLTTLVLTERGNCTWNTTWLTTVSFCWLNRDTDTGDGDGAVPGITRQWSRCQWRARGQCGQLPVRTVQPHLCQVRQNANTHTATTTAAAAATTAATTTTTDWLIDYRLYSAILRSLEQTHCARMWFYMSD